MTVLMQRRHVTVRQLSGELEISEATVRRDLKALADRNQLTLVHGGATLSPTVDYSFRAKQQRQVEEKRVIAALAASLVQDGDQIFLDSGTTCFEMAGLLQSRRSLSVLVNSARLALEFSAPGHSVIMLGGQYRPERMDTVGPITMSTLDQLRGYIAFIGADGLSQDFGPSASDIESAHLYRLVVKHARQTVLLADHTKFSSPSLFRIIEWESISSLVTDHRPDENWRAFFRDHEVDLVYPGPNPVSEPSAPVAAKPAPGRHRPDRKPKNAQKNATGDHAQDGKRDTGGPTRNLHAAGGHGGGTRPS